MNDYNTGNDPVSNTPSPEAQNEDADDALSAIDDLEALLSERHGMPAPADARARVENDGQYTIPLSSDVARPGQIGPDPDREPPKLSPQAQRLFDRLASEIDVIVQTGVDDALKAAARDIRKRVKDHVSIVLPEILDELSHSDDDDPML
tara:strand:- start:993 stop:1439 length:447 start_codon:yes stop_codon:yes gene_type:complete